MKSRLTSLFAGKDEQEAAEEQQAHAEGADPIATCVRGTRVSLSGVVKSVMLRPRAGVPAVTADLYDGTGHITLVWLGRRRIVGVEAGRRMTVTGRITCTDDDTMIFNPRYELHPLDDA